MDFFSGDFSFQPVISLISWRTSSAVARNSGLSLEGAGEGMVFGLCWARGFVERNCEKTNRKAIQELNRMNCRFKDIDRQDTRFVGGALLIAKKQGVRLHGDGRPTLDLTRKAGFERQVPSSR